MPCPLYFRLPDGIITLKENFPVRRIFWLPGGIHKCLAEAGEGEEQGCTTTKKASPCFRFLPTVR